MNGQLPFEGDTFIPVEILKLKDRFNLTNFIETGTQYGNTARWLGENFPTGITIEADKNFFNLGHSPFNCNITYLNYASQDILPKLEIGNTLMYLDAHGCEIGGCALKDELKIISERSPANTCIVIHDFKVPDHPELGYDTYDYELCYEEIEPYLKEIYPDGFQYHYNSDANGAMRGCIFIYPKIK
jgi:hypothetical protein